MRRGLTGARIIMLFNLLVPLADEFGPLNLFRYLTFRTGGAVITALMISFLLGPYIINWLKSRQGAGQPIRSDGPESHLVRKKGTPTMGGFLILLALVASTLLWANLSNGFVWAVLLIALGFGAIGFVDDYLKLTKYNPKGLSSRIKLLLQILVALIATLIIRELLDPPLNSTLAFPIFKEFLLDLGWFFLPMAMFVMVGASNAVNLTDGLDGLAIVPVMIAAGCFALIA